MGDTHTSKKTGKGRQKGGAQQSGSRATDPGSVPELHSRPKRGVTTPDDPQDTAGEDGRERPQTSRWRGAFWVKGASKKRNAAVTTAWITTVGTVSAATVTAMPGLIGNLNLVWSSRSSPNRTVTIVHTPRSGGVYSWSLPSTSAGSVRRRLYAEGQTIEIVCQIRDGETLDNPGEGRPIYSVEVWDRLPSGDWISDLYTNLENKREGDPLPGNVRLCRES